MEKEIELMNEIIANAIINGGDYGGPYDSNIENLVLAINNWLREKGLKEKYHVISSRCRLTLYSGFKYLTGVDYDEDFARHESTGNFPVLKIVPVSEKDSDFPWGNLDDIP